VLDDDQHVQHPEVGGDAMKKSQGENRTSHDSSRTLTSAGLRVLVHLRIFDRKTLAVGQTTNKPHRATPYFRRFPLPPCD